EQGTEQAVEHLHHAVLRYERKVVRVCGTQPAYSAHRSRHFIHRLILRHGGARLYHEENATRPQVQVTPGSFDRDDGAWLVRPASVHGLEKAGLGVIHADYGERLVGHLDLLAYRVRLSEQLHLERVVDDHDARCRHVLLAAEVAAGVYVAGVRLHPFRAERVIAHGPQEAIAIAERLGVSPDLRYRLHTRQLAQHLRFGRRYGRVAAVGAGVIATVAGIEVDRAPTHLEGGSAECFHIGLEAVRYALHGGAHTNHNEHSDCHTHDCECGPHLVAANGFER